MKINTNLPAFGGYYCSIFEDVDTSSELDYINEIRNENGFAELENDDLIQWDYNTYYSQLNIELCNCVEDFLLDLGMIKSIKFKKLHSPKYYNYSNDVIECIIDVNPIKIKKYIKNNLNKFKTHLIENHKSRDGFISFYEYDLNFWLDKMNKFSDLDHIEINSILNFICENEDFDIINQLYNVEYYNIPFLQAANFKQITENE